MAEKYIRENKNSYVIIKNSKNYGKFQNLDDAIFLRDELIVNNWDLSLMDEIRKVNDEYLVVKVIDEKLHVLARYKKKPSLKAIEKLVKRQIRNPNNSRYGLNITKVFDTYVIKKQIAGDDYIFGYYDDFGDCEFVRNHLLDNQWNVGSFSQIEYDADADNYKVVEVIDDKVYVLGSFESESEINITECHKEFLNRISKHKFGLSSYPYLDELKDKIPQLEEKFNVKAQDDVWSFENAENPLNDIIFNLTPFQKSVYDVVDNSTIEEIEKSLARFKSKNFNQKIQKNLDDLVDLGLIYKSRDIYQKR
jgi:hypothetical protein